MLFVEFRFVLFFAVVFAVTWALRSNRARKVWLLATSYLFYAAWDWRFLSLIVGSTVVDYAVGRGLANSTSPRRRRALLCTSLAVNLGLLGVFKYFDFFASSLIAVASTMGIELGPNTLEIVLPVGISFYTFQTLSYAIDAYHRRIEPTRDLLSFALFVAFFPQLVAGPIMRARDFLPQLARMPSFGAVRVRRVLTLFLLGFVKKSCVSDNIGPFVDAYFATPELYDGASSVLGVLLYGAQIYCDFSGYSDMAIATAALLGYRLCDNFRHPYLAAGLSDFWRRWHISLSTWLRDSLYIPLGGNRHGFAKTQRNLLVTMLLGGLWHGASWTFVVWGALHGAALMFARLLPARAARSGSTASTERWASTGRSASTRHGTLARLPAVLATYWFVHLAWIFFRAPDFATAATVARSYVTLSGPGGEALPAGMWAWLAALALAHLTTARCDPSRHADRLPPALYAVLYAVAWALALAFVPTGYRPFIYFQF